MSVTVATLVAKLSADTSDFQSKLKQAEGHLGSFGGKAVSAGKMLVGALAPVGLVGAVGAAISVTAKYEQSMDMLAQASGATGSELAQLSQLSRALGADISLPGTSAADAALAMLELSKAGLSVNDTMGAAKGVLQLSAAAGISNADAALIAANALNAFGLAGGEATRVADLLAAAANESSANVSDLALGFQMAGSTFASASFSINDLATSLALMTNAGIAGSDAGTSLKTMVMALTPSSVKATKAMEDLGFSAFTAQGEFKPLRQIIDELNGATKGLTAEQRALTMETIFGSDAIRATNVLLGAGVEGYDKMTEATSKQGAAADAAAARNKGFAGAIDALKSSIETAMIDALLPIMPTLTNFAVAVGEGIPDAMEKGRFALDVLILIIDRLVGATQNFDLVASPLMIIMAAHWTKLGVEATISAAKQVAAWVMLHVQAIASTAIMVVQFALLVAKWIFLGVTAMAQAAIIAASWLIALGPIGLLIAGVAALVVAVVMNWNTIKEKTGQVINWIKENWPTILAVLTGPFGLAVLAIVKNWDTIKGVIGSAKDWIVNTFNSIKDTMSALGATIWKPLQTGFESVMKAIKKAWNAFANGINAIGDVPILGAAIPHIPTFHAGGVVPGPVGQPRMVMAQGGEHFLTPGQYDRRGGDGDAQGPTNITINLDGREIARYIWSEHGMTSQMARAN